MASRFAVPISVDDVSQSTEIWQSPPLSTPEVFRAIVHCIKRLRHPFFRRRRPFRKLQRQNLQLSCP
jgi:hypothetical protein